MKLSKSKKILLGILSIWPIVYMVLFFVFIFVIFMHSNVPIYVIFPLHILTGFLNLGLTVFYVVHAIKHIDPKNDMRVIWIVILIVASIIANPIYWYLYIWKEKGQGLITQGPQEQRKS